MSSITSGGGTLLGSSSLVSPSTGNTGTLQLSGLASGLNDNAIIQDLLAIQQSRVTILQNKESQINSQQSAFQDIQSKLTTLQGDLTNLATPLNNVFNLRTISSSNPNLVAAAATNAAVPGVYSLKVNNLATANEIASQGFAAPTAAITQGNFTIATGSGAGTTITIDSTNNTLQGLSTAINNANVGITATIVNDGSGSGNQPYRLLLAANQTGRANAINITNSLAADNGSSVRPVFDATSIGPADTSTGYSGSAVPTANSGAGNYTGVSNNTYTFTVVQGGTVGTDNNIELSYTDSTGANTGNITLGSTDAGVFKNVAQGLQIQLSAGTLVAGQSFSVKAYVPTVQQASNASVTVGSGGGALSVQSGTNTIDNLVPGVTVNLLAADSTSPVTLTVASDASSATAAIQNFVTDYNSLESDISALTSFNASTNQAGLLLGNGAIIQIQNQLQNIVSNVVPGVNPQLNSFEALGITFNTQGQLQINASQLNGVLAGNVSGVKLKDVQNLFALAGSSANAGVQFVSGSDKTQASGYAPYQVVVTQAAQQASLAGNDVLDALTSIDNTNNTFNINVNGIGSGVVTIPSQNYSPEALAQAVQTAINSQSTLSNNQVTASLSGGVLTLTTNTYGSAASVTIVGGSALAALKLTANQTAAGTDVQGSFLVNGTNENAVGTGQNLVGASANANTADLQVLVMLTQAQVGAGTKIPLTVTRGVASTLNVALDNLLDPTNGQFATINAGLQSQVTSINKQITEENTSIQAQQTALVQKYAAMEEAVSQLQGVSNFLTQQFDQNSSSSSSSQLKL